MHERFAPFHVLRRDDEQQPAPAVCAHRNSQLNEHVDPARPRGWRIEAQERGQELRTVGQARSLLVDDLDLIAFEHSDVHELPDLPAMMLDDEQSGRCHLEDEAKRGNRSRHPPDAQWVFPRPDTQVNPGALDRGGDADQRARLERQWLSENDGVDGLVGESSASEIFGTYPSSRRRLAQNAASMIASISTGEGSAAC